MANPQQHGDRTWTREGVAQPFAPGRLVQSAHQTCPGPFPPGRARSQKQLAPGMLRDKSAVMSLQN